MEETIRIKPLYKYPVINNKELNILINFLDDYSPHKVALGMIAILGCRPAELCSMTRDCLVLNDSKTKVLKIYHYVYKPKNTRSFLGTNIITYKQVQKLMISDWLSDQLIGYIDKYTFANNKLFPFTTTDSLMKQMHIVRYKYAKNYPFLLDKNLYTLKGQDKTIFRVNLYALRRFAITFYYHTIFNKDIELTARYFGHTNADTTREHYVFPKDSIGLTNDNINIDVFLSLRSEYDKPLSMFIPELTERIIKSQKRIMDYALGL